MRHLRLASVVTIGLLPYTFHSPAKAWDEKESPSIRLAKEAYQAIKENSEDKLAVLVLNEKDFQVLASYEKKRAKDIPRDLIKKAAIACKNKCMKRLKRTRAQAKQLGLQWNQSKLRNTVVLVKGKEAKTTKKDIHVDILLVIDFGKQVVTIKLDDCFYVNGRRKIADGFQIQTVK